MALIARDGKRGARDWGWLAATLNLVVIDGKSKLAHVMGASDRFVQLPGRNQAFRLPIRGVNLQFQAGGWGGVATKDGENGLVGDGWAGQHRGGRGLRRGYRITADQAFVTGSWGRHKFKLSSMEGGQAGSKNYMRLTHQDGRPPLEIGKAAPHALNKGAVARHGDRRRLWRPTPAAG